MLHLRFWQTRRHATRIAPFHLVRSFSLLSLLCIGLFSVVLAWFLSSFLTTHLLQRDAVVTRQFVQGIMDTMQPQVYLEAGQDDDQATYAEFFAFRNRTRVTEAFADFFQRFALLPEVVRANIYASDETLIWSTQSHLIGQRFDHNNELQQALQGHLVVTTGTVKQHEKPEHVDFDASVPFFAEMYLPIRHAQQQTIIGVVEVYKVPVALFRAIAQGQRLVWIGALSSGAFLYAALFWIVRRAARLIQQQQTQLSTSEALVAVGEMTSVIVHNIRNPLAAIRSSAELMLEDASVHAVQPQVEGVIAEVDQLENWLRQLLTYARPLSYAPADVHLSALFQDMRQRYTSMCNAQDVSLHLDIAESLPVFSGDALLIQQVLDSLVNNALEAMPKGGALTVQAALSPDKRAVQIQLSDSGHGMTLDTATKALRPFFTTKQRGAGIGLSFVKRVMECHAGTMALSSTPGRGTTVTLSFYKTQNRAKTRSPQQDVPL